MKNFLFSILSGVLFVSCVATLTLPPNEVKMMTTKQIEADYNLVFASALSLLLSEGYLISNTDKETGIINASKQVDNQNAEMQRFLLGAAQEASTAQVSFFIQGLNANLTEVKLILYKGSVHSSLAGLGILNTTTKNSMVQKPEVYGAWFNNLKAEVERRRALLQ